MAASVICVSHTEGAGGEEIGRLLAERVQFRYVDDGIILDAARGETLYPEAVAEAESDALDGGSRSTSTASCRRRSCAG